MAPTLFMTRRPVIPGILSAGALVLVLALTGCGGSGDDAAADAGRPVEGGTLVYGVDGEPLDLDPHKSPQDIAALWARPVLDSLVALDARGGLHPWLATSWEVSDDRKTYTFKLRQGVRFSDGTPFDAAAVKANLDHIVDPATKSQMAAGQIKPYQGTEVVDAHTAKVTFSKPHAPFLAAVSTVFFGIQSPAQLKKGPDALARQIVGSGPFVIDKYTPRQGIVYKRNPDYRWGPANAAHTGPAHLERLEFKLLNTDSVRFGALNSGQVDAIASVPPSSLKLLERNPKLKYDKRQAPGGNYNYYPNTTKGPFSDVRVRRAFRDGVDYKTVVGKLYFGAYQAASSPLSPSTLGYDKTTETLWRYDATAAGRLLDEAGWTGRDAEGYRTKDGERLTVHMLSVRTIDREQRGTLAEQIQAEAKKIGFDLQIDRGTVNEYIARFGKGDYDVAAISWQRADADALRNLFDTGSISDGTRLTQNIARYSDKDVDGWLARALDTNDQAARAELYAKVQKKVTEDAAVVPIYTPTYLVGFAKTVGGISWEAQAFPTFYDSWKTGK
ncbi:ABC transporter substrate-binding protein [Thermomonospora umbrina]|uniref:Peptide/nickel transport system substrate-binding protein n=1 Tax=Thermomonospora umbrina TaxID=111806 RepID=A0A3D9SSX2_9ACTN|nr:ABC transporter substrate-binding protein [Thermomonospora umbrina]REE94801.1 peptide/nickel transport system substrate-binding protein [Thermomonospora umbrina]